MVEPWPPSTEVVVFRLIQAYAAPYVDACVGWKVLIRACSNHRQQDRAER